jgi:hypothetical protein
MTEPIGVVESYNLETIARRKGLRKAVKAVEDLPQANSGKLDLVNRTHAIRAIAGLEVNGLPWGCIRIEEGEEPPEGTPAMLSKHDLLADMLMDYRTLPAEEFHLRIGDYMFRAATILRTAKAKPSR